MKDLKRNLLLLSVPFYIAAVLIFACSKSNPVESSRNPFWQQTNGPRAGYVMSLVADAGNFIYAGTQNGGVFRTENQGDTWTQTDLTIQLILALAVDSKNNLFAGTAGVEIGRASCRERV